MTYCDIHAHLADQRIHAELPEIFDKSREMGVCGILACAARRSEWEEIRAMSGRSGVYGALGIHPFFINDWREELVDELRNSVRAGSQIPAIGEIGLDFYYGRDDEERQREIFAAQLQAAAELGVPVIVHNRKSWNEFFEIMKDVGAADLRGVCHHFTGSREIARQALDAGFYLSFCGPLTYTNARSIKDAARYAPLDRILTETDTPDLPTAQHRDEFSYPWHVSEIVAEIARLKELHVREVLTRVFQNFCDLLQVVPADVNE